MLHVKKLWNDEGGAVLSAEVVLVGTVAVLGSVTGLHMAAQAVDEELREFAYAIRSLDQSYAFLGHHSCRAWSAGSCYRQPDVQQSLSELCGESAADVGALQQKIEAERLKTPEAPVLPDAGQPPANQLPEPSKKPAKPAKPKKVGQPENPSA
jgi:hypothetical protein